MSGAGCMVCTHACHILYSSQAGLAVSASRIHVGCVVPRVACVHSLGGALCMVCDVGVAVVVWVGVVREAWCGLVQCMVQGWGCVVVWDGCSGGTGIWWCGGDVGAE